MQSIHHPPASALLQGIAPTALQEGSRFRGLGRGANFHRQHLWVPLAVFVLLSLLLMGLQADQWLADRIYAWEGHAWSLQSAQLTQGVLHAGGRQASQLAWLGVLLSWLAAWAYRPMARWRLPLAHLLLSVLLSTALVGLMKRWTHMDCPWDLLRYGGDKTYYGLLTRLPAGLRSGGCFPAGHASAGYAWIALYFCFRATVPRLRWWGLAVGLGLGLAFGIAQQLRGAHFLSHDVWALMACWLVALALDRVLFAPRSDVQWGQASA